MADIRIKLKSSIETLLPAQCLGCGGLAGRPDWLCDICERSAERNLMPCPGCAIPMNTPGTCKDCTSAATHNHPRFASISCPLVYRGLTQQLIKRWKFAGARELTPLMLRLALHHTSHRNAAEIDAIVPMPMHWIKQIKRGYNQAELLARALANAHYPGKHILHGLSASWRANSQHNLNRRLRGQNVETLFRPGHDIKGQRLMLVDDVLTTGATARAANEVLLAAGAREIHLWCLARSP